MQEKLENVKTIRRMAQIFVAFSEKLNFNDAHASFDTPLSALKSSKPVSIQGSSNGFIKKINEKKLFYVSTTHCVGHGLYVLEIYTNCQVWQD